MDEKIFLSESGKFFCDENYIAYDFEPAEENIISDNTFKHFVVPEGVVGFGAGFGYEFVVKEKFALPESLREIGDRNWNTSYGTFGRSHVFASVELPTVIIPDSVEVIGTSALCGGTIDVLCLPKAHPTREQVGLRQFKGLRVHKLYLHIDRFDEGIGFFPYMVDEVYVYRNKYKNTLPADAVLVATDICNNNNH